MSRGLTNTYVTSSAYIVRPAVAVYMDFSGSAPVRVWTGLENKTLNDPFGSGSYLAVGHLGTISAVNETTDLSAKRVTLSLTGIPNDYISLAMANPYRGRPVAIFLLLFNADYSSYEQITLFRGRMDQMVISDSAGSSTVSVTCESRLVDMNVYQDLRYTNEAQKTINPADNGMVYVAGLYNKTIYWGNAAPNNGIAGGANVSATSTKRIDML